MVLVYTVVHYWLRMVYPFWSMQVLFLFSEITLIVVYCACCLGNHEVGKLGHEVQPHFYVNVADIETLESEVAYIACRCIPSI